MKKAVYKAEGNKTNTVGTAQPHSFSGNLLRWVAARQTDLKLGSWVIAVVKHDTLTCWICEAWSITILHWLGYEENLGPVVLSFGQKLSFISFSSSWVWVYKSQAWPIWLIKTSSPEIKWWTMKLYKNRRSMYFPFQSSLKLHCCILDQLVSRWSSWMVSYTAHQWCTLERQRIIAVAVVDDYVHVYSAFLYDGDPKWLRSFSIPPFYLHKNLWDRLGWNAWLSPSKLQWEMIFFIGSFWNKFLQMKSLSPNDVL